MNTVVMDNKKEIYFLNYEHIPGDGLFTEARDLLKEKGCEVSEDEEAGLEHRILCQYEDIKFTLSYNSSLHSVTARPDHPKDIEAVRKLFA